MIFPTDFNARLAIALVFLLIALAIVGFLGTRRDE